MTVFYGSLLTSKPFQNCLLNKGTWKKGKSFMFALYCLVCFRSSDLTRWQNESLQLSISCQLTQSCAPMG